MDKITKQKRILVNFRSQKTKKKKKKLLKEKFQKRIFNNTDMINK